MFPRLNLKAPHGEVYAHKVARYLQNGVYFTGTGIPCTTDDAGELVQIDGAPGFTNKATVPEPNTDPRIAALESQNAALLARLERLEGNAGGGPVPVGTAPIAKPNGAAGEPQAPAPEPPKPSTDGDSGEDSPQDRYAKQLNNTQFARLKKAFKAALEHAPEEDRIKIPEGAGAKGKIVDWMLTHTSP